MKEATARGGEVDCYSIHELFTFIFICIWRAFNSGDFFFFSFGAVVYETLIVIFLYVILFLFILLSFSVSGMITHVFGLIKLLNNLIA